MSQHDYVINNDSGASVRADINSALSAIQTLNSGTSEPSSTAAGMLWLDTTGGAPYGLKIRDAGNNHWLTIGSVTDPGANGHLDLLPGKINLPSSGGIYESDGSTEILTESSGAVTLKNTTIDATATFPTGVVIGMAFLADVHDGSRGTGSLAGDHLRDLNTTLFSVNCPVTISSNEFSFNEAGDYIITAKGTAFAVNNNFVYLSTDGGSTELATGSSRYVHNSGYADVVSTVSTKVTIGASEITSGGSQKDFGVWHYVSTANTSNGFGVGTGGTTVEQFTQVLIHRISS